MKNIVPKIAVGFTALAGLLFLFFGLTGEAKAATNGSGDGGGGGSSSSGSSGQQQYNDQLMQELLGYLNAHPGYSLPEMVYLGDLEKEVSTYEQTAGVKLPISAVLAKLSSFNGLVAGPAPVPMQVLLKLAGMAL